MQDAGKRQLKKSTTLSDQFCDSELGSKRGLLMVGHPGHELRVFGWLALARPLVLVLTDGSGVTGVSRLETTSKILADLGARPGQIYGRFKDADIYRHFLEGNKTVFCALQEELINILLKEEIDYVAVDAYEEFNPTHDLCHVLALSAAAVANETRSIRTFAFNLEGNPNADGNLTNSFSLVLDDELFEKKIAAALQYCELAPEVERTIQEHGRDVFRHETFFDALGIEAAKRDGRIPGYEKYGEQRVRSGIYQDTIRLEEHMMPIFNSLKSNSRASLDLDWTWSTYRPV